MQCDIDALCDAIARADSVANLQQILILSLSVDKADESAAATLVNRANSAGQTPLMHAIGAKCDIAVLQWLLFHGARCDRDALHRCVRADNLVALEYLIQRGAHVHGVDSDGHTALHLAAQRADRDAVRILLRAGAHVDVSNARLQRVTPLIVAAEAGSAAVVAELLAAGADVNRASNHDTPLMAACSVDALAVVDALIAAGADANVAVAGRTALHCAVVARSRRSLRRLLTSTVLININDTTSMNHTILATAVHARDKDSLAVLLAAGANLVGSDRDGLTPLLLACYLDCSLDLVALLLVAGSDHTVRERHHRSPQDLARSRELRSLIDVHVGGTERIDLLYEDNFQELALLSHATRRLERERFVLRRARALTICVALQTLHLPALLSVMVIDEACEWQAITMHVKWRIATLVKHFHNNEP